MKPPGEVIHRKPVGQDVVLARTIPKKLRDRWNLTEQFSRMVLRGKVQKTLGVEGLRHAFVSLDYPEDGCVGIKLID
jgi:hypothetical protein